MKVICNGREYEIKTQYVHEQTDAFYEALERGDAVMASFHYIPPTMKSWESIQREMDIIKMNEKLKLR